MYGCMYMHVCLYMHVLLQAFAQTIREEIGRFPEEDRDDVVVLFSAHSLPMKVSLMQALYAVKSVVYQEN